MKIDYYLLESLRKSRVNKNFHIFAVLTSLTELFDDIRKRGKVDEQRWHDSRFSIHLTKTYEQTNTCAFNLFANILFLQIRSV